jgi:metal-responsive CopG/Arc/MetJ family transcriptional regulator
MVWKTVCFKLEEDIAIDFYDIVQRKNKQISEVLRELVREYVEREKYREVREPKKIKVL